jgi:hypothetical protein
MLDDNDRAVLRGMAAAHALPVYLSRAQGGSEDARRAYAAAEAAKAADALLAALDAKPDGGDGRA